MRHHTILFLASLAAVSIAAGSYGCGDDNTGEQPQTASVGPGPGSGGMAASSGGGGEGATGGNPTGMGGNPTGMGGGMGGSGGDPEQPLHGCLSTTATNMQGQMMIDLGDPRMLSYPFCAVVDLNTTITVGDDGSPELGDPIMVGGMWDGVIKLYDAMSPIQPTCAVCNPVCNFDPNDAPACFTGGTWTFGLAGAYPFYNNFDPANMAGVIYVVP